MVELPIAVDGMHQSWHRPSAGDRRSSIPLLPLLGTIVATLN
jgi:hypothetical protein